MLDSRSHRNVLLFVTLICTVALVAYAADGLFAGKWKGELAPQARGGGASGGEGETTGTPGEAPSSSAGGGGFGGGGGGFGRGGRGGGFGGGGFGGGGFGGGSFGGPQKVSLNLKQSKDNKVSGNITFGEGNADDVKEGRVVGNTITFKAGRPPQPVYAYYGELKDDQLVLTRTSPDGRGRPQEIILTRK